MLVRELARLQAELGWRVTVACPVAGDLAGVAEDGAVAHVPWAAVRSPARGIAGEARALARIVAAQAPDVVHLHSSKAGLDGRLALRGRVPTVFEPNGWSFLAVGGATRAVAARWERIGARWADAILCVSERERELGEAEGIRGRWQVVPNAVDLSAFGAAGDGERADARRRLDLADVPTALCVGRIRYEKGVDVLLDAWPRVLARIPDAQLVLVGDGPDAAGLAARSTPGVRFAGERSDVKDWLAAADVVAIPSRWEGMSAAMLEALARGRPVVSTDVSGAREVIGDTAGAVVPIEATEALGDALADRLADPHLAAREGAAGRAVVERDHDVRRRAERVLGIYERISAGR